MGNFFDRPRLSEGLDWYLQAFFDLIPDRHEQTSPIPFYAMEMYAQRYGIDGDDFERFRHLIKALDGEHLSTMNRKMKELNKV